MKGKIPWKLSDDRCALAYAEAAEKSNSYPEVAAILCERFFSDNHKSIDGKITRHMLISAADRNALLSALMRVVPRKALMLSKKFNSSNPRKEHRSHPREVHPLDELSQCTVSSPRVIATALTCVVERYQHQPDRRLTTCNFMQTDARCGVQAVRGYYCAEHAQLMYGPPVKEKTTPNRSALVR